MKGFCECCKPEVQGKNELAFGKPILHYFDLFGRASPARLAFTVANESFIDRRIKLAEWPEHKANFLTGQVPALEIGADMFFESVPISYYAARNTTLIPKTSLEQLQVESLVNFVSNAWKLGSKVYHAKPEEKEQVLAELIQREIPRALDVATLLVNQTSEGNGIPWASGMEMSLADIWIYCWMHQLQVNMFNLAIPNLARRWPRLYEIHTAVEKHPKLKNYLKTEC